MKAVNALDAVSAVNEVNAVDALAAIALAQSIGASQALSLGSVEVSAHTFPSSSPDLGQYTPDEIDRMCPFTRFSLSGIDYVLPKLLTLKSTFEKVVYPKGDPSGNAPGTDVIVYVDGVPHHIYAGIGLACSNLAYRPIFLAPEPAWKIVNGKRQIRPFEHDLDYMCLKFGDYSGAPGTWHCGAGHLAQGVTGTALRSNSPLSFLLNQINWGQNTWSMHWEFPLGLGAIAERIPPSEQTAFAKDLAWNLNPNDFHADGSPKVLDYIAALAVKTATNRSGVHISPYNTRHLTDLTGPYYLGSFGSPSDPLDANAYALAIDPTELNQGERETSTCDAASPLGGGDLSGCFGYFREVDVASLGTIGGLGLGVIDVAYGPAYLASSYRWCSWMFDWNLPGLDAVGSGYVKSERSAGGYSGITLITSPFKVAVSLSDDEVRDGRCPVWGE